ncbi:PREDICTED: uncharacterized protein C15orf39 homolog, partial [Eurypyga helias]|uniref:uncharacterized protein C15orf39 homolog n=1 Tax=Eurypyga helias TaxID=54383 RepID=UPI000528E314
PSALPGTYKGFVGSGEPFLTSYLKPQAPRSYFPSPLDTYMPRAAGTHRAESPRRRETARRNSAFQPVCAPEKVSGGSGGTAETTPKGEGGWVKPNQGEQEAPDPEKRRASLAPQETRSGGPIIVTCKVEDAAKDLVPPSPSASSPERLKDPRDGEGSPSSPPMPVINNVFSLAPYRDYLEGTESSPQVPFSRQHLQGDTPPRITGSSREPAALSTTGSSTVQSQGESCYGKVPEKPKPVPQDSGSQGGSPNEAGSGKPAPKDVVLDLSLKKRLVKARETRVPVRLMEGTLKGENAGEKKEGPGGKVRVGEGPKPQALPLLLEVASGDKSNFQSSATFMFKKYKILRSLLPSTVPPQQTGARLDPQQPPLPETPRAAGEDVSLPRQCEAPAPQTSAGQYFTTLHTSLCDLISCSVSRSSPELLQEWLKKAKPTTELGEMPKSPPKPKNGSKIPEPQKPTKGKEIWLAFQDVATLLTNLLSQLETFMFARKCPFPHVVRAGAIFIPIHVVKEKLFPKLPGASVDQVLQEHKVELRPTTLSEERHLRELELKSCTSRMLKLLALKQLPDIYPDLWVFPMASPRQSQGVGPPDPMDVAAPQLKIMICGEREEALAVATGPVAHVGAAASGLQCRAFLVLAICLATTILPYSLGTLALLPWAPPGSLHAPLSPLDSPASQEGIGDNLVATHGDPLNKPAMQQCGKVLMGSVGAPGCFPGAEEDMTPAAEEAFTPAELMTTDKLGSPGVKHVLPLQFRLLGIAYTEALSSKSSSSYRELEEEVMLMLNQMLSTYEAFLQANVLEFMNGSVVVRGEALFRGNAAAPTNSHLIRTIITEASKGRSIFSWQLEPQSVQSSGFSLENLDPEKLSISLTMLQLGRNRTDSVERLSSEVVQSLSALYHVRNFTVSQLRNHSGNLEITGDIYLDTIVHVDVAGVLQALTALATCSVDLTSLLVEGARLPLQVYPVSFLITNRHFSNDLLDPLAVEHQELTRDLGDADALEPPVSEPGLPEYSVVIMVMCGLCIITAPIILLVGPEDAHMHWQNETAQ